MDLGVFKARIRELGFASVLDFFIANPGVPYGILYRRIAKPVQGRNYRDIPFLMLEEAHRREAVKAGLIREYAMDTLVRSLRQHIPQGWNKRKNSAERRSHAYSQWQFERTRLHPCCKKVWAALDELHPPDDWCPDSPSDKWIVKAFEIGWPADQLQVARQMVSMTGSLIEVIDRLDEVASSDLSNSPITIYAKNGVDALPTARAIVCLADEEASEVCPEDRALKAVLTVECARAAIEVWSAWRGGKTPSRQDKFVVVLYFARHQAFMPVEG